MVVSRVFISVYHLSSGSTTSLCVRQPGLVAIRGATCIIWRVIGGVVGDRRWGVGGISGGDRPSWETTARRPSTSSRQSAPILLPCLIQAPVNSRHLYTNCLPDVARRNRLLRGVGAHPGESPPARPGPGQSPTNCSNQTDGTQFINPDVPIKDLHKPGNRLREARKCDLKRH